jgi:hypothetical protein
MTDKLPQTANYKDTFKVYRWLADGQRETIDSAIDMRQAANAFWRASNNFSAKAGLTVRVMIVDWTETAQLLWEYGKGYTYNGRLFKDRPVLEDEPTWQ